MSMSLASYANAVRTVPTVRRIGRVSRLAGLGIEVHGLHAAIGELCSITPPGGTAPVMAEVVGVRGDQVAVMAYGGIDGLARGSDVVAVGRHATIPVGEKLLGRVMDPFGAPLDGRGPIEGDTHRALRAEGANPMQRPRIARALETGVRTIDSLLTLGQGQRIGIFAGSGVGKSTLIGMIARHVHADVNVIALVGERGREVKEFIERHLGDGLKKSVVVVAPADQPALARVRAAHAAMSIAEYFRDQGRQVVLTMDSVTRFAMARREVGLAAGEPPTARGYTPSVFAELPQLCERCGTGPGGGSITALMTVLVEGDDFNEPIADHMRAILDGHIVLSRHLAQSGHYPAIDVLQSASRVMPDVVSGDQRELAMEANRVMAVLERNRQLVDIGAYERGSNPALDAALELQPKLSAWLRQREGGAPAPRSLDELRALFASAPVRGRK